MNSHITTWLGYPVKDFEFPEAPVKPVGFFQKLGLAKVDKAISGPPPAIEDGDRVIYRLRREWDTKASMEELFAAYLANPSVRNAPGIIIGAWMGDHGDPTDDSSKVVRLLVDSAGRLPALKGIFLGEMVSEECEISWINQSDVSPLLTAYPALEHLRIRGGEGLSLGSVAGHARLKSLTIETGGLGAGVVRQVLKLDLPALEHLELWLGTDDYGGDAKVADLAPLLSGQLFPSLRYLGLRDAQIADEVAAAVATSPLLERLSDLDLSKGTLSDEGARHLLNSPALHRLRSLDLHHHYLSTDMMKQLEAAFPGVNLAEQEEAADPEDRYVAVGE